MNRADLMLYQEVVVYNPNFRSNAPGWVTRIARKYVTIANRKDAIPGMGREFDITTQRLRGDTMGVSTTFSTLEQAALANRTASARLTLKEFGLQSNYPGPTSKRTLTLREMEAVIELLRGMDAEAQVPDLPAGS